MALEKERQEHVHVCTFKHIYVYTCTHVCIYMNTFVNKTQCEDLIEIVFIIEAKAI